MDSLYLLIPLSLLLVLAIGGLLAWSVLGGQFENLDAEGTRILEERPAGKPEAVKGASEGQHTRNAGAEND